MAKWQTVFDNFDDNSFDTGKWGSPNLVFRATETNQRLEFTLPTGTHNCGFESVAGYDLANSFVQLEMYGLTVDNFYFYLYIQPSGDGCLFYVSNGTVHMEAYSGGSYLFNSTFTYNATTHRWFRLRETSGVIYWETSPDSFAWTVRGSVSHSLTLTTTYSQIYAANLNGVAGTAFVDNFNIPAAVPADELHSQTLDAPTLTQVHNLTVADELHSHAVGGLALTQQHTLVVPDMLDAQLLDGMTLENRLNPPDLTQTQTLDSLSLTQQHLLTVAGMAHAQALDPLTISIFQLLVLTGTVHAQLLDNITIGVQQMKPGPRGSVYPTAPGLSPPFFASPPPSVAIKP